VGEGTLYSIRASERTAETPSCELRVHESDCEAGLPRNGASVGQAVLRLTVNASERPEKSSSSKDLGSTKNQKKNKEKPHSKEALSLCY